ncbi:unnamed protein product [Symbiodinium natans]|uniref:Uncharacterized protein n=1 Tax=Symbiodinium natans TaxID=878477 RepID=A0A812U0N0_9DINO|nr:unnamed protein product [Symbiodinium natans]
MVLMVSYDVRRRCLPRQRGKSKLELPSPSSGRELSRAQPDGRHIETDSQIMQKSSTLLRESRPSRLPRVTPQQVEENREDIHAADVDNNVRADSKDENSNAEEKE